MPTLRFAFHWLAELAPALGVLSALTVSADIRRDRRSALLREEDLTDWLLRDIGWKDGRDTSARDEARDAARRRL